MTKKRKKLHRSIQIGGKRVNFTEFREGKIPLDGNYVALEKREIGEDAWPENPGKDFVAKPDRHTPLDQMLKSVGKFREDDKGTEWHRKSCGYYLHGPDAGLPRPGKLAVLLRLKQQEALLEHSKRGSLYRNLDENIDLSEFFSGKKNEKKTAVPLKVKVTKPSKKKKKISSPEFVAEEDLTRDGEEQSGSGGRQKGRGAIYLFWLPVL